MKEHVHIVIKQFLDNIFASPEEIEHHLLDDAEMIKLWKMLFRTMTSEHLEILKNQMREVNEDIQEGKRPTEYTLYLAAVGIVGYNYFHLKTGKPHNPPILSLLPHKVKRLIDEQIDNTKIVQ
ncbi:MAG: hypothetical protein HQK77_12105 [Desulfobacterales bacterium]|nr:hypothetical protein [Desulfobacterales bacterium]